MKRLISFSQVSAILLVLFAFLTSTSQLSAQTSLNYGDVIHLQNAWNKYGGGYLDTRGYQKDFEKTGNHLCVSTATATRRDGGSGSWRVLSATGKKEGTPVLINDDVYLLNQWNKDGGYLDTRGYQKDYEKTGNHLCVSTAKAANRDSGSGTWKIISAKGTAAGTPVKENDEIQLQNGWNKFAGGYLDTRGYQKDYEKTGNHLCVSTATAANRDSGSGTWKVTKAPTLYGDVIHLQNGWNKYGGGFLDTRGYQKDFEQTGNFLCVSTALSENRDGGSGSWKIMSATGKKEGTPVLVNDDVHLLNQWSNNGGYLDTRGYQKDYEKTGNHLCVSTATAANRDSGSGTWKIRSAAGSPNGSTISENSEIQLQNGWNKFAGGYLDTRGYQKDYEKTGNHLCVSTATAANRDSGSGTWKIVAKK